MGSSADRFVLTAFPHAAVNVSRAREKREEVWCELQQLYALTETELQAFMYGFEASDYLDTEFVHYLHEVRKVRKIALLSNNWPDARHVFGDVFGLATLADIMVLSCEEGLTKPDRRIYDLAADRLGLPHASIVFIDDYPPNVSAARDSGMHDVLFETCEQTMAALQPLLYDGADWIEKASDE